MGNQTLTAEQIRARIGEQINSSLRGTVGYQKDLIAQAAISYERKWGRAMPDAKKAILANSLKNVEAHLLSKGTTKEQISQAVSDISQLDNPITLLFNLMSIIIPNFAYTEAIGIQPMPTKNSPIYFPQIVANETRNGVTAGTALLGASNWNTSNTYSTNRNIVDGAASVSGTTVSFTASEHSIRANTFVAKLYIDGTGTALITDDGQGNIPEVDGFTTGAGTINYSTGAVSFTLAAALGASDTLTFNYRYELDTSTQKPAQVLLKWVDKNVSAEPYRLRTKYELDDFYQAKQVLAGYDIDAVLSTSLSGLINKEISGNVFDDILLKADADYTWIRTAPTGVSWANHRLSLLQTFVEAGNGIRTNIGRSGGNVAVCGVDWMNFIETLGTDLWEAESYSSEPIGPYVAGTLGKRFKVIKNTDYPAAKAAMVYKTNEVDASVLGGSFISLYATPSLTDDDLTVRNGVGTRFGYEKSLDNSIVSLTMN